MNGSGRRSMLSRSWCLLREIMKEPQSAHDLAAWFGCCSKTIRREFTALAQIGVPIEKIRLPYAGPGKGTEPVLFWLDADAFVSWLLGGGQQRHLDHFTERRRSRSA